jgi:hypothetical protein
MRLIVASSAATILTVRTAGLETQRFDVGRRARRLRITLRTGRSTIALHLSLGSGTSRRMATVTVAST